MQTLPRRQPAPGVVVVATSTRARVVLVLPLLLLLLLKLLPLLLLLLTAAAAVVVVMGVVVAVVWLPLGLLWVCKSTVQWKCRHQTCQDQHDDFLFIRIANCMPSVGTHSPTTDHVRTK